MIFTAWKNAWKASVWKVGAWKAGFRVSPFRTITVARQDRTLLATPSARTTTPKAP